MAQPTLIVVSGPPGSGKTTLAHALARAVPCPAICRDEIREGFVRTSGSGDTVSQHVYAVFFSVIELLVGRGITLVVEAAFQHKLWAPGLEPLLGLARLRVIQCRIDTDLARDRIARRLEEDPLRRLSHPDSDLLARMDRGEVSFDPLHLDVPVLAVDTTDGYRPAFEEIVAFVHHG